MKRNGLRLQPVEPVFADEFTVSQERCNFFDAEYGDEALKQGDATIGNGQHQKINIGFAELPISAI